MNTTYNRPKSCFGLWRILLLMVLLSGLFFVGTPYMTVSAQQPDTGFNADANGDVLSMAVQPDGKILIGGAFTEISGHTRNHIARLHINGEVDLGFDPDADGVVHALAVQADGKILVGGEFTQIGGFAANSIARLNSDGSKDMSLIASTNGDVLAVLKQTDGKILIGGNFSTVNEGSHPFLARLTNNGSIDSVFSPGVNGLVNTIALQSDGKIIIGGQFDTVDSQTRYHIARIDSNGSVDSDFMNGTDGPVHTIALQADGKILFGGAFNHAGGETRNFVGRMNEDGTLDMDFNPNANSIVETLIVQPDGNILVGGGFTSIGGESRNYLARIFVNGSADQDFDPDANFRVFALALQPDCKILVGGAFTMIGGTAHNRIARIDNYCFGIQWEQQNSNTTSNLFDVAWGNNQYAAVGAGGTILTSPDAVNWTTQISGLTNELYGIAWGGTDFVTVGGNGTILTSPDGVTWTPRTSGVTTSLNAVNWNGSQFVIVGDVGTILTSSDGVTWAKTTQKTSSNLYGVTWGNSQYVAVGGPGYYTILTSSDGSTWNRENFLDNNRHEDVFWTGSLFVSVGEPAVMTSPDGITWTNQGYGNWGRAVTGNSNQIVTVGLNGNIISSPDALFWVSRDSTTENTLRGITWGNDQFVAVGLSGTIITSFPTPTGYLRVTAIPEAAENDGAQWSVDGGNTWYESKHVLPLEAGDYTVNFKPIAGWSTPGGGTEVTFNPDANGSILAIAVQADGKILVGGEFTKIEGLTRNHLARLNPDGTLDYDFNPNVDSTVKAIGVQSTGKILIGGNFSEVGGISSSRFARLNSDGTKDTTFDAFVGGGSVACLLVLPGDTILVGGSYSFINGSSRNNLAWLSSNGSVNTGFMPNPNGAVYSLTRQADGKFLLGGSFSSISGTSRNRVARFNTDGSLDTGFVPPSVPGTNVIYSLGVQPDGKILAGGYFSFVNEIYPYGLYRLNADGTLDSSFSPKANSTNAIHVQQDGKILIGGSFSTVNGESHGYFARLLPDGSLDLDFDPAANNTVMTIVEQGAANLLVGGYFTNFDGMARNRIAKLNGDLTVEVFYDQTTSIFGTYYQIYAVDVSAEPLAAGEVSGSGIYHLNQTLTVRAEPFPDYNFVNWTDGGVEVSALSSYSFNVTGDRTLVANFAPDPPDAFGKSSPSDNSVDQVLSPTLSWETSTRVDTYEYCIDTVDNDACDETWASINESTSADLSGLLTSTTYYWQVRAVNPGGETEADSGTWWSFTTVPDVPDAFGKNSPVNAVVDQSLTPTLTWEASTGASSYEYCVDTTEDDACDGSWISADGSTNAVLSGLTTSTTYYWQVRAVNPGGETQADGGVWWSFTTIPDAPDAFGKNSPVNAVVDQSLTPTLTWEASTGASSYEYCVDTTEDDACDGSWVSADGSTSANLSGLANGTTYYWQVRAVNPGGETQADGGAWWSFTTVPDSPAAFGKTSPADGAVDQSLTPTLTWEVSTGAVSHEYCVDTTNDDACDEVWISVDANTSVGLSGLTTSTTYYWQVRAVNPGGETEADGGAWWSFTTVPDSPTAFGKTSPVDGSVDQSLSSTLTWETSTGAISYEYCVDTTNDDVCDASWSSVDANTSVGLSGLTTSTTYYWQVRAVNPGGETEADSGTWWSFTTVPDAPLAFGKTSPADGAVDQSLTPTLTWETSTGAISYEYCVDTTDDDACDGSWVSADGSTSANLSGLANGTTYYWQVRAVNPGGETEADSGTWWFFMTVPDAPLAFGKTSPADGAVNQLLSPTLAWEGSTDAVSYEYCVDTTDDDACDGSWVSADGSTSANLSGLLTSTTYYWQVRAVNPGGETEADSGTWWSFTTEPNEPDAFGKTSPADVAVDQSLTPTLTWETSTGAISYQYCFDTTDDDACDGSWVSTDISTSTDLSSLANGITYYWQVRAVNPGGETEADGGIWWSFSTIERYFYFLPLILR